MEAKLGFSFDDKDFTDFLPEIPEKQFYSRWADFNHHDPGVTTVEALNFSYEDFIYRYNLPIQDLLQGKIKNALSSWGVMQLHPQYAISENDYRSILGIYETIRNVVVLPTINENTFYKNNQLACLLNVNVAADSFKDIGYWQNKLLKYRSLGEYYNRQKGHSSFIKQQVTLVNINANVTFYTDKDTVANRQKLRYTLENYLLPNLKGIDYRYLNDYDIEMDKLQVFFSSRETYSEPLFILPEILNEPCYRRYIVVAELFEELLSLPFINSVELIEIGLIGRPYKTSVLDCGTFTFTKLKTLTVNDKEVKKGVNSHLLENLEYKLSKNDNTASFSGVYKNLGAFNSVQLSYPPNYEIGINLANQSEKVLKTTSSFRAFLYFMDQIRADVSAQIGNLSEVFAINKHACDVATKEINNTPFYQDLTFNELNANDKNSESTIINEERKSFEDINDVFDEQRFNYLLALNGWSLEDEIITVNRKDMDLLKIKKDFLFFVHYGIKKRLINKRLNKIFRAVSLIMLQQKIKIVLQTDIADVRILEHCFLQPVWKYDTGLNFEITIFLFPKDKQLYKKQSFIRLENYAKKLIRAFTPVQIIPNIRWQQAKESDGEFTIKQLETLLIDAYPPKEYFYFDTEITESQKKAMEILMNKWVCYK